MNSSRDVQLGRLIRKFRLGRHLTLKEAALALLTSTAVLSRKERGEQPVEREDIPLFIRAYELAPPEIQTLWSTAGLLPDTDSAGRFARAQAGAIEQLLGSMTVPSKVVGHRGIVVAWNREANYLWRRAVPDSGQDHVLDIFFSPRVKRWMDSAWEACIDQVVRTYYLRTRPFSGDPSFQDQIDDLAARFGAPFADRWRRLESYGALPPDEPVVLTLPIRYEGLSEPVTYAVLNTTVVDLVGLALVVYIPSSPFRHARAVKGLDKSTRAVVFAPAFDNATRGQPSLIAV